MHHSCCLTVKMVKIGVGLQSPKLPQKYKRVVAFLEHPVDGRNSFSVYLAYKTPYTDKLQPTRMQQVSIRQC